MFQYIFCFDVYIQGEFQNMPVDLGWVLYETRRLFITSTVQQRTGKPRGIFLGKMPRSDHAIKGIDIKNDHDFENNIKNDQKFLKISKMTTHAFWLDVYDFIMRENTTNTF